MGGEAKRPELDRDCVSGSVLVLVCSCISTGTIAFRRVWGQVADELLSVRQSKGIQQ